MLMRQILANAAWDTPDAVAVRDGPAALTYGEIDDRVHRLATALDQPSLPVSTGKVVKRELAARAAETGALA